MVPRMQGALRHVRKARGFLGVDKVVNPEDDMQLAPTRPLQGDGFPAIHVSTITEVNSFVFWFGSVLVLSS